uniref:Lipase n=1 Tax=Caenorhabditis tropicalis TaxID=1561998 RepID=A0A1I7U551_9PELO
MASLNLLLLVLVTVPTVSCDFSPSFRSWINTTYGQSTLDALARTDIGSVGSFGGGTHDGLSQTNKRPILIVHGITNTAGTFNPQRNYFLSNGWSEETVHGTTYGDGGVTPVTQVKMTCAFVKQLRKMLEVVNAFTQQKVDVVGYSLGSPIIRKAILGGTCVDTNENLGGSYTHMVETYVSVAGANRGSTSCTIPWPFVAACNSNNGLYCGSQFLSNINSQASRYEGTASFSIYGPNDDKVGNTNVCSANPNSRFPFTNDEMSNAVGNHDAILANYVDVTKQLFETQAF